MITQLLLTNFGKFKNKSFTFSDITVFQGPNESGKSTIFDALFENISKPKGTSTGGRELRKRYGDSSERISSLECKGEKLEIDEEEFLNLYAVKSGAIYTNLASGSNWIAKIQSSLFTGGIDPRVLYQQLSQEASEKKSSAHIRQLLAKQGEKEDKEALLKEKKDEREKILQQEKENKKSGTEQTGLLKKIKENEKILSELKEKIGAQEKLREKNKLYGILRTIDIFFENIKKLNSMAIYEKDRSKEIEDLEKAFQLAKEEGSVKEVEAKSIKKEIDEIEASMDELHHRAVALSIKINPLNALYDQIEREQPKPIIRQITKWNKPVIAIALAAILSGILLAVLMAFSLLGLTIAAASSIAAIIAIFATKKTINKEETAGIEGFTQKMLKRWREIVGEEEAEPKSISEINECIINFRSRYAHAQDDYKQLGIKLKDKKADFDIAYKNYQDVRDKQIAHKEARQGWFTKMQVEDLTQYGKRILEYSHLKNSNSMLENELKNKMLEQQCEDVPALKSKVTTLAMQYEKELSGTNLLSDIELAKLKKDEQGLSALVDNLREQEKNIAEKFNKGVGHISGALGNLPETIADLQRQIGLLEKEIRNIDLKRRASGFAAKIFEEISEDSSMQFAIVSNDIALRFGEFMPGMESVQFGSFSEGDIRVKDGGGKFRLPEQLSTGTRDAFWLAARLSLALKARPEESGILVLDEPFHALDLERVKKAVELLKKFWEDSRWQIVLFTKDEILSDIMKTVFQTKSEIHIL